LFAKGGSYRKRAPNPFNAFLEALCSNKPWLKNDMSTMEASVWCMVAFYFLGTVWYSAAFERWSALDSWFFLTHTMTTVGYGDNKPSSAASKVATIVWALFGVCLVAIALIEVAEMLLEAREILAEKAKNALVRAAARATRSQPPKGAGADAGAVAAGEKDEEPEESEDEDMAAAVAALEQARERRAAVAALALPGPPSFARPTGARPPKKPFGEGDSLPPLVPGELPPPLPPSGAPLPGEAGWGASAKGLRGACGGGVDYSAPFYRRALAHWPVLQALAYLAGYMLAAGALFAHLEGWSLVDGVYFAVVTGTSIGY
jgi:hypothetical protein